MTDAEIDSLTGEALDIAISEAMEPIPAEVQWCTEWWDWLRNLDTDWKWKAVLAQTIEGSGGNISVALMKRLDEWGWSWSVECTAGCKFPDKRILCFADAPGSGSNYVSIMADGPDEPIARAKWFYIEYSLKSGAIQTAYDKREKWESVLKLLDASPIFGRRIE